MITINGEQPANITKVLKFAQNHLESLGYSGEIVLNLVPPAKDDSLLARWNTYLVEYSLEEPDSSISGWSPNNGSAVGKLMTTNRFIRCFINKWYNNFDRNSTESMTDNLYDFIADFVYYKEALQYDNDINLPLFDSCSLKNILTNIEAAPDSPLKKDFLQCVEMFFDRNPRFVNDW